jgi:hypothetical protein
MKTATIDERFAPELMPTAASGIRMFKPESGSRATLLQGNTEQVAAQLIEIFRQAGVL